MRSFGAGEVVIAALVLAWIVFRQVQPRPLATVGRTLAVPAGLAVLGLLALGRAAGPGHGLTAADAAWLTADLGLAVVSGVVRAPSVRVFERDGQLWRQGGALTVALWLVSIGARVGLESLAAGAGAGTALADGLPLTFGVSLAVQYAVISLRARRVVPQPVARAGSLAGRTHGRHSEPPAGRHRGPSAGGRP